MHHHLLGKLMQRFIVAVRSIQHRHDGLKIQHSCAESDCEQILPTGVHFKILRSYIARMQTRISKLTGDMFNKILRTIKLRREGRVILAGKMNNNRIVEYHRLAWTYRQHNQYDKCCEEKCFEHIFNNIKGWSINHPSG